ncbi:anthranilate synthase component I family protein [Fundicoccus ignavus]|uniref:Anthranilate synthase component 1 n=1 Tax=Fundicoccus ignavus TaxID=2664442 RepID=A0A844C1K0_9LACT|nr:chorismate-binding protein [Fundicoccus ignavus]MRJ48238.1 anthranilate synthase component I [Fundicoccus ignavus]
MIRPSLEEARQLGKDHTIIPIALEIFSDVATSIEVLRTISKQSDHFYLLESVVNKDNWSRYSFIGYKPNLSIYSTDGQVTVQEGKQEESFQADDPLASLTDILDRYKSPSIDYLPPFTGGLVGYLSYDCIKYTERSLQLTKNNPENFRDYHFMLMDKVIAFDHFRQKIVLIVNIETDKLEENYIQGATDLKDMEQLIMRPDHVRDEDLTQAVGDFEALFSQEDYERIVEKIQHHIVEGDIFQAVVSNRFKAPFSGSLLQTYRLLRTINPSPYMVYMHFDDLEIACASPETLVSVRNGVASSFPLAGTVPRGETDAEDRALVEGLLENEKELAEHDMLVDLARNDIGKVAEFGTLEVSEYRAIKQFSHVSHISSKVTAKVRPDATCLDVLKSALPAGTLSGAPKIRACQLIDEIENTKRGPYGGALGYIDFAGNMDMCIGIRMAVLKNDQVFVQSGAGIVADSDPEKEYLETKNKAKAMMTALGHEEA